MSKARIWCRDCGEEMKQYPYGILTFGCKKCKLKATVEYQQMPIVRIVDKGNQ